MNCFVGSSNGASAANYGQAGGDRSSRARRPPTTVRRSPLLSTIFMKLRVLITSMFLLFGSRQCAREPALADTSRPIREYIGPEAAVTPTPTSAELERRQCEQLLRDTMAEAPEPGAPGFESERAELLARAKAEPVFFVRAPEYEVDDDTSLSIRGFRKLLARSDYEWDTVRRVLSTFHGRPRATRAILLREGYLYAEDPELAYALVSLVQPQDLFGHDRIWIQRGDRTFFAQRRRGRYYYEDGPLEGERVRLLHLDRLGHGAPPDDAIHRDFRSLKYRLHFDRMKIRHVTERRIVANLRYGNWWVPSVLSSRGAKTELECEVMSSGLKDGVEAARAATARRQRAVQALRMTMLAEIAEGLPFDEPEHEYGHQLDGKLRKNWIYAYSKRRKTYAFNGDRYYTFDKQGRPLVPQVCVDFLTDTLERTSGTWWLPQSEAPERRIGGLDFDSINAIDRVEIRRIPKFVEFARSKTSWFEVYDAPASQRAIKMGRPQDFYRHLEANADNFLAGDIVVIRGKTPWDWQRMHYHSFYIYENDPVTGMPLGVVGNAGKPSIRSWETEARRTPLRTVYYRIRPRLDWLESIVAARPPDYPLPLAAGRQ